MNRFLQFLFKKLKKALDKSGLIYYNHHCYFCGSYINGGIAQLARAFGSYPKCRRFKSYFRYQWPGGQEVKTPPFHGGNTSSILVRVTKISAGVVEWQTQGT